jgi:cytochrome d ubiquinol oxidase subunit II
VLLGWGLAQHPYLVYPDVTFADAAAPLATIRFILLSLPVGALFLLPSLWLLYGVFRTKAVES